MTELLLDVRDGAVSENYREWALGLNYQTIQTGDETWRGIALVSDPTLPELVKSIIPTAVTSLTFFRKSPERQEEPNFIHSDEGMGEWTAILYLNPHPADGDGTSFWRFLPSGDIHGSARALNKDAALWECWKQIHAVYGRLLLFDSLYFHSRSLIDNYGSGDDARLVQVAFGSYA